jgi:SH3-like domain-containing protein
MRIVRTALFCLIATALPAAAQTLVPPPGSAAQAKPPSASGPVHVQTAPRVPVVREHGSTHAQKPVAAKPGTKPAAKPAAAPPPVAAEVPAKPAPVPEQPAVDLTKGSVTHLPTPRFMSLRFDDVNLRVGPGLRYPIDWVYHRRDLPVEIVRELDDWRLVQDQDNIRGWIRAPALSPRRGFVVREAERPLRAKPADDAAPVAMLKPGVVGHLRACAADSAWCEVETSTFRGFVKRIDIFGVYPGEAIGG